MMDKLAWAVGELKRNGGDREWWRNRLLSRVNGSVQKVVRGYDGVDVMAEDWDTLIVFDACRADYFEARWPPEFFDSYRRVRSKGSWTVEWAARNFVGEYGDTVYTTANPLISRHVGDRWHRLAEPWKDGFDNKINSVHPETVTERAIEMHREYPNKRHVVHYIQPHAPFIKDDTVDSENVWEDVDEWRGDDTPSGDIWDAFRKGSVTREQVETGYEANLNVLTDPVQKLLNAIEGKVVLTSDHGEVFGRYSWPVPFKVYGHPPEQRLPGLVRVPWAEFTTGNRRTVVDDGTVASSKEESEMTSQLEALGYV